MTVRPAPEITLSYAGNSVALVPSLRAATILEQWKGGFPGLLQKLEETDFSAIKAVIRASSTSKSAVSAFFRVLEDQPIRAIQAATVPACLALLAAVMTLDMGEADTTTATRQPGKPTNWADLYSELFGIGTGWLGWTAAETWSSTIPEIIAAFDAQAAKLRAIHGGGEDDETTTHGNSEDQRQANIAAGLDPDFDRAGLHALKAKL